MTLIDVIKKDQVQARKNRNDYREKIKAKLLTTLLGDAMIIGKNDGGRETTDAETIAVIKKFIKNAEETLAFCHDDDIVIEHDILSSYLPKQLSEDELKVIITSYIDSNITELSMKNMGSIMKHLNSNYAGTFDGRTASSLVKSIICNS